MTNVAAGDPKSPAPQLFIPAGWKGEGQPPLYTAAQVAALKTGNHEELAHELFAAAQLAPGEGIEDAVSRIAAALTAAHAQPAAPQGVAYAPSIEDLCARIKAADDAAADRDYMLDSNDCIAVLRGQWKGPMAMDKPDRAPHGQAPAGATNTKTHALLSTMIGLFLRAKEKIGYQPGSAIDKTVAEAVEHLKDWPYPETATAQAAPAAGAVAGPVVPSVWRRRIDDAAEAMSLVQASNNLGKLETVFSRALSGLRSIQSTYVLAAAPTPATQADSVLEDAAASEVLMEHSGCGSGTQVDMLTVRLNPGDKVIMLKGRITQAIDAARKQGGL